MHQAFPNSFCTLVHCACLVQWQGTGMAREANMGGASPRSKQRDTTADQSRMQHLIGNVDICSVTKFLARLWP